MKKKRLGKGLEDISHFFISQDQNKEDTAALAVEERPKCHVLSVVDLFNPHRGALFTSKLSLKFCKSGSRTLVVDTDTRFPSVAFTLGVSKPGYSLSHYFQDKYQPEDILCPAPFGLKLLAPHLDTKYSPEMDKQAMGLLIELLASIEKDTDIIVLRHYKKEILPLIKDVIFFVPVSHSSMIMAYREIKTFISAGDNKRVGLIITDNENEDIGRRAYDKITECLEIYCGIRPYLFGYLPDISGHSISAVLDGIEQSNYIHANENKDKEIDEDTFFGRLQYLTGKNNITQWEISRLLRKPEDHTTYTPS